MGLAVLLGLFLVIPAVIGLARFSQWLTARVDEWLGF